MQILLNNIEITKEELIDLMEEITYRVYPKTTIELVHIDNANMSFEIHYEY